MDNLPTYKQQVIFLTELEQKKKNLFCKNSLLGIIRIFMVHNKSICFYVGTSNGLNL